MDGACAGACDDSRPPGAPGGSPGAGDHIRRDEWRSHSIHQAARRAPAAAVHCMATAVCAAAWPRARAIDGSFIF
eukprot:SAG31_NODE_1258_length_9078_cov_12.076512_8_plen_75_part_00